MSLHVQKKTISSSRPVASGGAGGAKAPPVFGQTVNPISTRGDRLCPPQYYEPPRIFRPCDGPDLEYSRFPKVMKKCSTGQRYIKAANLKLF